VIILSKLVEPFTLNDCNDWNRRFNSATRDNNKKEIMSLLNEANTLYLDEYYICSTISSFNNNNIETDVKDKIVEALKKCKSIKNISKMLDYISLDLNNINIKFAKLTDIVPEVINDKINKENVIRKDKFSSVYLSQIISFQNSVVTGYVYGISDKSKKMHTWLEFKNHHNQYFVIDYDDNTIYNKEGYYFLKHAELIKKVSSDELKGKSSVSKSDTSEISNEIVDIEIDMGDER
jgi:hypothetical protein